MTRASLITDLIAKLDEVRRALTRMAQDLSLDAKARVEAAVRNGAPVDGTIISDEDIIKCATRITRARRLRDEIFGGLTFFDPSWDMLLDLFVQQAQGRAVSVSSLCLASAAPPTTALRHIASLEQAGWITRRNDPEDGRRTLL